MTDFRVELKVCEGCGSLWLRAESEGVYCRGCALRLSEFPAPKRPSRRARVRARKAVRAASCVGGGR
jgi:hypothetical protein